MSQSEVSLLRAWSLPIVTITSFPPPNNHKVWWTEVSEALAPFADATNARLLAKQCTEMGATSAPTPFTLALGPFITFEFGTIVRQPELLIVRLSKLAPWSVTKQFQELADHALFLPNRLTVNLGGKLYLETSQPEGVILQGRHLGTHARVSRMRHADGCHVVRIDPAHLARVAFFPGSCVSVHGVMPFWMEQAPHSNPHVLMAINEIALCANGGHVVTVEYDNECCGRFSTLSSRQNSPVDY